MTAKTKKRKPQEVPIVKASPIENVFSRPIMLHVCKDGTLTYRDKTKREKVFNGVALPVFSVDTVEEAQRIQTHFCSLQYTRHPHKNGPEKWYVVSPMIFRGELEDLDRVMVEFAKFWAESIKKTREARDWAHRLWRQITKRRECAAIAGHLTSGAD